MHLNLLRMLRKCCWVCTPRFHFVSRNRGLFVGQGGVQKNEGILTWHSQLSRFAPQVRAGIRMAMAYIWWFAPQALAPGF